ncbi:EF-hand domain-containing protein [Lysobacter sp. H23M47]|uniref:EF-hand domain-containing protein n=1 Tax=Lysobacter sp. H23M47 TaxID=2781024 RepID=UPI001882257A|nr:EF-hand domain-containing protein [Lysobacter sp. H23M47]QOW23978.1 EF-hand domain-containing protein [Lysobacter sp. H23M47]
MKHPMIRMSALAVAVLVAGAALASPQAATDKAGAESPRHDRWLSLDANKDGVIDRNEAARHPRLVENFDRLDRNSDGKLERSELQRSHARRGSRRGHDGERGGRMGHWGGHGGMARHIALDADGDGRISKLEAEGSRLAERFAEIDTNKDGYLVRSELQTDGDRRRAEFQRKAAERFDQRFKEADSNGDGRLSRAEYEAAWPGKAKMFAFLDEDRDGYLTREDLAPRRGR